MCGHLRGRQSGRQRLLAAVGRGVVGLRGGDDQAASGQLPGRTVDRPLQLQVGPAHKVRHLALQLCQGDHMAVAVDLSQHRIPIHICPWGGVGQDVALVEAEGKQLDVGACVSAACFMWLLRMEEPQAAFVAMLMDRLQALEGAVQQLQEDNAGLQRDNALLCKDVSQLTGALRLGEGVIEFTDGWRLCPGFTKTVDRMWDKAENSCHQIKPLDAICCWGLMEIQPHEDVQADSLILVGRGSGRSNAREGLVDVTVRELIEAINAWCSKPFWETTNYMHYLDLDGREPLMEGTEMTRFNHSTQRWLYIMERSC